VKIDDRLKSQVYISVYISSQERISPKLTIV